MAAFKRTSNVLDKFRSYSYHFSLVLCDTTETANQLSLQENFSTFKHPSTKFTSQSVGGSTNLGSSNNYVVLINTMTDSEFLITQFKYTNVFLNDQVAGGTLQSHTQSFEGVMSIQEPLGLKLFNVLQQASHAIKTDLVGCIWLVKIFFVGHTLDGKTETISNLKPVYLIPLDVISEVTEVGTTYNFEFVGAVNGFGQSAQVAGLVDGISFSVSKDKPGPLTVEEGIKVFEQKIDKQYTQFKEDYVDQRWDKLSAFSDPSFDPTDFRPVKYSIQLGPDSYQGAYYKLGTDSHRETTNTGKDDPVQTWGYKGASIETAILQLLNSSREVKREASGNSEGIRYIPKITSEVVSTNQEYRVVYIVNRYKYIGYTEQNIMNGSEPNIPESQTLYLNYLFTGENLDIIEYAINMEFGMSFLMAMSYSQSLALADSTSGRMVGDSTTVTLGCPQIAHSRSEKIIGNSGGNTNTPLFLGTGIQSPSFRNVMYPAENATYLSMLNRHAAYEVLDTKVKIRGNPALLTPSIKNPPPQAPEGGEVDFANFFETTPGYAKIRVLYPNIPGQHSEKYSEFWYKGYYVLFSVEHTFVDGEFTQELEMVGLPIFNDTDTITEEKEQAENVGIVSDVVTQEKVSNRSVPLQEQTTTNVDQPVSAKERMTRMTSRGSRPKERATRRTGRHVNQGRSR